MLIQDLEFAYRVDDANELTGGASAKVKLKTSAKKGKASASGSVKATGDKSKSLINTKAKVIGDKISYSYGHGLGYGFDLYNDVKIDVQKSFSSSM